MNIEQEIKTIVQSLHQQYVHLVDGYELNNIMPKLSRQAPRTGFVVNYIPEGGAFDIDEVTGKRAETSHVQMMWCGTIAFDKDGQKEADNIAAIFERKKLEMNLFVDAVNASGLFEPLTHYAYQCIPLRFDAVCACLITTFELVAKAECIAAPEPEPEPDPEEPEQPEDPTDPEDPEPKTGDQSDAD